MAIILLVSLLFVGFSLQPFDVSHPLSVTRECVQGLPASCGPVVSFVVVLLGMLAATITIQSPTFAFPLDLYQFYDPLRGSPVLQSLRTGRLASRHYN